MDARTQFFFWSGFVLFFVLTVYIFQSVLMPFVLGIAVAYLLNPIVNRMCAIGLSRIGSTILILGIFCVAVLGFLTALLPVLYHELLRFSEDLPIYIDEGFALAEPLLQNVMDWTQQENGTELKALLSEHAGSVLNVVQHVWGGVAAGGQAFVGVLSVLVIVPIVAFFMMVEWPRITAWCQDLLPRDHEKTIMNLLKEIDKKLAGFVRGQITVAFILGVLYAVALSVAGLQYGLLIGLGAGILSVIPMLGSVLGFLVAVGVALFQTWDWQFVLMIGGIFVAGQIIEGNFLTPKLVGDSVGLHPMWIFFALIAGGALFGILGMLLAVPVAAVASVLLAFGLLKYKQSSLYKGKKESVEIDTRRRHPHRHQKLPLFFFEQIIEMKQRRLRLFLP